MNKGMQECLDKNNAQPVYQNIIDIYHAEMEKAIPEIERRCREREEVAHLARLGLTLEERQAVLDIRRKRR